MSLRWAEDGTRRGVRRMRSADRDGRGVNVEDHLLVRPEDEGAGVLESPRDIGDSEVHRQRDRRSLRVQVDGDLHGVVLTMEVEETLDRDRARRGEIDL